MNKEELIRRAVGAVMDDKECRIYGFIEKMQEEAEGDHQKAVNELAELVFAEYPNKGQVEKAMREIYEGLTWVATYVGDKLYLQGFIDAAELMGVHITHKDIQECRDRENERRERTIIDYFLKKELKKEAERLSKVYGIPISFKIEEELVV